MNFLGPQGIYLAAPLPPLRLTESATVLYFCQFVSAGL
jgi:hypothetical protein